LFFFFFLFYSFILYLKKKKLNSFNFFNFYFHSLRIFYTKLILNFYETSITNDIEQSLWKIIFYKVIEALRGRIRRLKTIIRTSNPSDSLETELQKTSSTFSTFLSSATKFYLSLVAKLEHAFGVSDDFILPPEETILHLPTPTSTPPTTPRSSTLRLTDNEVRHYGYLSCYRCYIFLGDLTRYLRDIGGNSSEWMEAAKYYNRALRLFPTNGNPHNQLAVLATYVNDDFNAMYHYFRSMSSANPFPTSKENLMVLFEKNKAQAENLQEALSPLLSGRRRTSENRVLRDSFLVFFIRIHGILFTKASMEKMSQYKTLALKGFEELLQLRKQQDPTSGISDPLLLKVFVINIYAIWACLAECDIQPSDTYAEKMKKSVMLRHTGKIAVEFFGRTVRACLSFKSPDYPFLGPLSIFTDWFAENVATLIPVSSQDKGPWHQMWKVVISLLNKLLETDNGLVNVRNEDDEERMGEQILQEEMEIRGFVPFTVIHSKLNFSRIPLFDFSPFEIAEITEISQNLRMRKMIQFSFRIVGMNSSPLHFLEEKSRFTDRPMTKNNGKKIDPKIVKKTSIGINLMDPNAEPINPYDSDFPYDEVIQSSPIIMSGNSMRSSGVIVSNEDISGEDEEGIYPTETIFENNMRKSYEEEDCKFFLI
jgi:protein SMG7